MGAIIAIQFKTHAMICADVKNSGINLLMAPGRCNIFKLNDFVVMAAEGESSDIAAFSSYMKKSLDLYRIQHGYELDMSAVMSLASNTLASPVRTAPYSADPIIIGYDEKNGPQAYAMNFTGIALRTKYCFHGCGEVAASILDLYYREDMNIAEGYELIKKCIWQIMKRHRIRFTEFTVALVDKNGYASLPDITMNSLYEEKEGE